jgi:plastocyanin
MKKLSLAAFLVIASLALVACGGGSSSSSSEPATSSGAESAENNAPEPGAEGTGKAGEAEEGAKEAGSGSASSAIDFEANPEGMLMFEEKSVTAKAGDDTIDFTNTSSVPHNVAIEDSAGKTIAETETISEGTGSAKVELEPGTYTYYCSIPGHREAGMEGTLTVK